jgi:hypothetical protein
VLVSGESVERTIQQADKTETDLGWLSLASYPDCPEHRHEKVSQPTEIAEHKRPSTRGTPPRDTPEGHLELRQKAGKGQGYSFKAAAVLPPRAGKTDVPPFIAKQAKKY